MNKVITALKYFGLSLVILSLFYLTYSFYLLFNHDLSDNITLFIDLGYKILGTYSDLYKFTFIVCAFWATLRQLEISQNNYNTTLNQVRFIQSDILEKRNRDITNETLSRCNYYLNELQVSLKELIETNIVSGIPLEWKNLNTLTSESLKEKYPTLFERMKAIERPSKNQILITLYKLEAFSSLFIHGNLDKNLAREIIGDTYSKQIGFLLGIISFFRHDNATVFGQNTINLYTEWQIQEK